MFRTLARWLRSKPTPAPIDNEDSALAQAGDLASASEEDHSQPFAYDENLLERSRTQWQFGDWASLAKLDRSTLQHHPDRATLALLAAAGRMQTDNTNEAAHYFRVAQEWGARKDCFSRILIAGVHNNLGRAAILRGNSRLAYHHFESSLLLEKRDFNTLLIKEKLRNEYQSLKPILSNTTRKEIESKIISISDESNHPQETMSSGTTEEEIVRGNIDKYSTLKELHAILSPRFYLEIGVFEGKSLSLSNCRSIAIDPSPKIKYYLNDKIKLYKCSSDEFFSSHGRILNSTPPDLVFIDGLHLFEYALRDFMNIERWSSESTLVIVDDIYPNHPSQALRNRSTRSWTGDIWKLYQILKIYRPDLSLLSIDVNPTGLLLIGGLNSGNNILWDNYENIIENYKSINYPPDWILNRKDSSDFDPSTLKLMSEAIRRIRHNHQSNDSEIN